MADINYINYGDQLIDQLALLNNLADNVLKYVASLPWSRRRKEKFMSAYSDIINRGIQGASSKTGQWTINVGGDTLNLDELSKKDREMYQEAAYFIRHLMASIPIKEEEKKKEAPVLSNEQFLKDFGNYLGNSEFGGQKYDTKTDWTGLDTERDSEGKLSTKNRRTILARILEDYSKSIKDDQYNFEGSPFTDLNDFRTRILNAINAINTDTPDDDNEALNKLGLKASDWFYSGLGDDSGKVDSNGNPLTYGLLALLQKTLTPSSNLKTVVLKLNPLIFRTLKANFVGKTPQELKEQYGDLYSLINALNQYSLGDILQLNADQKREVFGAMRMAKNNISDNLYNQLVNTPTYRGSAKNRFKVIEGVDNYIYDVKTGNIIQVLRGELANQETDLFSGIETDEEKELREELEADSRKLSEDFRTEDTLRMAAIAQDIAASVAAFVPTYGTATAGALGFTSLGTNMAADIMDKSVTKGEVAKNALINLGLGVVGLVPGLGAVGKGAKWLTLIAKWTPRILTLANAGNIALNDDIKNSLVKLTKVNEWGELTNHDVKNIAYALSVTAGLSRGANAIRTNRQYGTGLKGGTKTVEKVKTKSGKEIEISKEKLSEINKALSKGDEKGANKIFKAISDKTKGEELELETKHGIGGWKKPIVKKLLAKSSSVTTSTGVDRRAAAYQRALNIKNIRDRNSMPAFLRNSKIPITDYEIYNNVANLKVPELKILEKAKRWWNPIKEGKFKSEGYTPRSTGTSESSSMSPRQLLFNRATINKYKEYAKGNFRKNDIKVTDEKPLHFKFDDLDFNISLSANGKTYSLKFNKKVPGMDTEYHNLSLLAVRLTIMKLVRNSRINKLPDGTKTKRSIEETGKLLRELKRKGVFKQGGRIDKQKIQKYKDFINK